MEVVEEEEEEVEEAVAEEDGLVPVQKDHPATQTIEDQVPNVFNCLKKKLLISSSSIFF